MVMGVCTYVLYVPLSFFFSFFFFKVPLPITLTFFVLLARWLRVFAYGKVLWAGAVFVCLYVCLYVVYVVVFLW